MPKTKNYRKIWSNAYGPIPKDEHGRSFQIHHIDGNRNNNDISNLKCVSIEEHYNIHYRQKEYVACALIAKHMQLSSKHISSLQIGVKRPGIGGVKKGTTPWNKGISGYKLNLTEEGKKNKTYATKKNSRISDDDAIQIRNDYHLRVVIDNPNIGKIMRNGKKMTYERAFTIEYAKKFNVSDQYIYRILKKVCKIV